MRRPARRRRWPVLVGAVALVLLVGLVVALLNRGGTVAASPPTTGPAATTAGTAPAAGPSPSPSPTLLAGFSDCSATVGRPAQCGPRPYQCWGSLTSAFDSLTVATPASCDRTHVYQTFAAGALRRSVMRQSQVDADRGAKATCTAALVNAMLRKGERRDDWEVYAIPAQSAADDDGYFRCVFGRGERSKPLVLIPPG